MKVDIADLRERVNRFHERSSIDEFRFQVNEALNELEELRRYRNNVRTTETENLRLTQDLARITEIKDRQVRELRELRSHIRNLIDAGNLMRDELTGHTETTSFKKWFKNLHPETIESVTITLRKKEN